MLRRQREPVTRHPELFTDPRDNGKLGEFGDRLDTDFTHHIGAMTLHGAFVDTQIDGYLFVQPPLQYV